MSLVQIPNVLFTLNADGSYCAASRDVVVAVARQCLEAEFARGQSFNTPRLVKDYLVTTLAQRAHEVFGVMFLDAQQRLIEFQEMFRGTLTQTSVYPREVVREALKLNAAAVVLSHNHPSGLPEPSRADEHLTQMLKGALALVDVQVLDHIVVGGASTVSFAERGML